VNGFSTREAAKKLGLGSSTLARYVSEGKIPVPKPLLINGVNVRSWTDDDIERARKVLPKIANGRKTRYQKTVLGSQFSVPSKKAKAKKKSKSKK
jgi:excisionase family DNA binding protein